MKAHEPCGVLAVLILVACGNAPDPNLFAKSSTEPGKTHPGGAGSMNTSGASSGGGAKGTTNDVAGASSMTAGGSADMGAAGDPGVMNGAGSVGTAGALGAAGSMGMAGSVGSAGSVASEAGAAGSAEPPAPVCGNGIIEAGEQCDAGGAVVSGCDASCKVVCSQHGQGTLQSEDHHCYAGYNQTDFAGSEQDCVQRGAHLATISSTAENKLVRGLVANSKWLGGNEDVAATSQGTGTYAWVTGESFDFTNWAPQEPNRAESHCPGSNDQCYEHCIVMLGDGTWADHRCDIVDGYVCEWEPAGSK